MSDFARKLLTRRSLIRDILLQNHWRKSLEEDAAHQMLLAAVHIRPQMLEKKQRLRRPHAKSEFNLEKPHTGQYSSLGLY